MWADFELKFMFFICKKKPKTNHHIIYIYTEYADKLHKLQWIPCKNELSFVWGQFIDLYKLGGDI